MCCLINVTLKKKLKKQTMYIKKNPIFIAVMGFSCQNFTYFLISYLKHLS